MTSEPDQAALLALVKRKGARWGAVARATYEGRGVAAVAQEEGVLNDTLFDDGGWDADVQAATQAIEEWQAEGLRLITVLDTDYPARLQAMQSMPPFLFVRGTFAPADAAGIAIVGSRRASEASLIAARELAAGVASRGQPVISGLAAGIDTAAHSGALDAGGRTVAVIGTGIRRSYPRGNEALQEQIANAGLLISQFWPDSPPTKVSFPMRNELMSAWAAATCVVQADSRSGARMQARVALQQGRKLFLHHGMRNEEWARKYVDEGRAQFVTGADDMLDDDA